MAGVYRPRHPERTVLYRVLFHYFDRFLAEYEDRFQKEYGFLRPIIKQVVEKIHLCPDGDFYSISGTSELFCGFFDRNKRLPLVLDMLFVMIYISR